MLPVYQCSAECQEYIARKICNCASKATTAVSTCRILLPMENIANPWARKFSTSKSFHPPSTSAVELILALPRPIMLQRILKQATVMGIRRLHLIRSAKVEKSFFQTPVLEPEKIRELLLEGLTQAMDTCLPEVHIHRRFKPFVQDV
ncbi:MAG: hypothetical protein D3916_18805, partial [Candidatus Electrothrix sp. MAN1_4]|nr:hypothetical protein [Candidatus Electrothrix sp. MAN1_4]